MDLHCQRLIDQSERLHGCGEAYRGGLRGMNYPRKAGWSVGGRALAQSHYNEDGLHEDALVLSQDGEAEHGKGYPSAGVVRAPDA
jgi:hypothetical protein